MNWCDRLRRHAVRSSLAPLDVSQWVSSAATIGSSQCLLSEHTSSSACSSKAFLGVLPSASQSQAAGQGGDMW